MEPGRRPDEPVLPAGEQVMGQEGFPGAKDSALLAVDAVWTLLLLLRSEAALAARCLPTLISLSLYRLPAHLLAWLSVCVLLACVVHALTGMLLLGVGTFAAMQVGVVVYLELRLRQVHKQMSFPESRQGLAMFNASMKARFKDEVQG